MALGRAAAVMVALASRADSIAMHSVQTPMFSTDEGPTSQTKAEIADQLARNMAQLEGWPAPTDKTGEVENFTVQGPKAQRRMSSFQYSERHQEQVGRPPWTVQKACTIAWNYDAPFSAWQEQDPPVFPEPGLGARRRVGPMEDMDFQLFLPSTWNNNSMYPYPVIIYLHSHAERKWAVMNGGSLPRLLAANQSTSFDNRACWCLNSSFEQVEMYQESSSVSEAYNAGEAPTVINTTRADCRFSDNFNAIVIIPQGWTKKEYPGWYADHFQRITSITRAMMNMFNGDADRVIVTGMAEGATGALKYAKTTGSGLVASVIVADAPNTTFNGTGLDSVPVLVSGDETAGVRGLDNLVLSLKARTYGDAYTRYRRYVRVPAGADPSSSGKYNRSSDIIYRDPTLWEWAFGQRIHDGRSKWDLPQLDYVVIGQDHHSQPRTENHATVRDTPPPPRQPEKTKPNKPHHAASPPKKPSYGPGW